MIMAETKDVCSESLTGDCFSAFPQWAKMVLAIRLLFLLFPPWLSRYLFSMMGLFPFDPGLNLPPWLFVYPVGFYPPGTIFPGDPSPFPPTPPGIPYPFPPPATVDGEPDPAAPPTEPSLAPPTPAVDVEPAPPTALVDALLLPPTKPPLDILVPPIPPPRILEPEPVTPVEIDPALLKPRPILIPPLTPEQPIIPTRTPWLRPTFFVPPAHPGSRVSLPVYPTLFYYEPFQGPQICVQEAGRWKFTNVKPDKVETCPTLPIDESWLNPSTGLYNRIEQWFDGSTFKMKLTHGGGPEENYVMVTSLLKDMNISTNNIPFDKFKLNFSASITSEDYTADSWIWIYIYKKVAQKEIYFPLANAAGWPGSYPNDTATVKYRVLSQYSGSEVTINLQEIWPGDGDDILVFRIKAEIAGGAVLTFSFKYFDLYSG